jgi:PHD/YefM family antitoxin component YafN of YafNO toxin-antitoxin module
MRIESATNVKNHFGAIMDAALREPVIIQRSGRDSVMMVSCEDFKEFIEDQIWGARAMEAEKDGYLGAEESEKVIQRFLNADS